MDNLHYDTMKKRHRTVSMLHLFERSMESVLFLIQKRDYQKKKLRPKDHPHYRSYTQSIKCLLYMMEDYGLSFARAYVDRTIDPVESIVYDPEYSTLLQHLIDDYYFLRHEYISPKEKFAKEG